MGVYCDLRKSTRVIINSVPGPAGPTGPEGPAGPAGPAGPTEINSCESSCPYYIDTDVSVGDFVSVVEYNDDLAQLVRRHATGSIIDDPLIGVVCAIDPVTNLAKATFYGTVTLNTILIPGVNYWLVEDTDDYVTITSTEASRYIGIACSNTRLVITST